MDRRIAVEWASALGERCLFPPRDRGCIVAAMHPFLPFTNDEEYRRLFSSSQSEIENRFHLNAGGGRDRLSIVFGFVLKPETAGNCNET